MSSPRLLVALIGVALIGAILLSPGAAGAATLVVDVAADVVNGFDGDCSLREAIVASNLNVASGPAAGECAAGSPSPGADRIVFTFAGAIAPAAANGPLPALTGGRLLIDGWSAPGAGPGLAPQVVLNGVNLGADNGLTITSAQNGIRGLRIINWGNNGIRIEGAGAAGNFVQGCFIGTGAAGLAAVPNLNGISIGNGASGNLIGTNGDGTRDLAEGNLISGNDEDGISVSGDTTFANRIAGNRIGTTSFGAAALPNGSDGIQIAIFAAGTIIGTDSSGGPGDAVEGNLISGNAMNGVNEVAGVGTIVAGNRIGLNAAGTAAIPNLLGIQVLDAVSGIRVGTDGDGVSDDFERNVISGNTVAGIDLRGNGQSVAGNYVGTDAAGTAAVPNGLGISADIGPLGTSGQMTIGGPAAAFRNVISGHDGTGLQVTAADVTVECNYFGTDATGTAALPNVIGLNVTTGTNVVARSNLFSFNTVGVAAGDPGDLLLRDNSIAGNSDGVSWNSAAAALDAIDNWWGDASGPKHPGNPGGAGGIGDTATETNPGPILYAPWLAAPPAPCGP